MSYYRVVIQYLLFVRALQCSASNFWVYFSSETWGREILGNIKFILISLFQGKVNVELAALHAAAKNMINPTAHTGGPYAGGALSRSPYIQQM